MKEGLTEEVAFAIKSLELSFWQVEKQRNFTRGKVLLKIQDETHKWEAVRAWEFPNWAVP